MQTELGTTKRKKMTEETKRKLLDAMEFIMKQYDFDTVTIRNICTVAGVSYGSFYHLFETKEDFLRYYLSSDFLSFKEAFYNENEEFRKLSAVEKSIDIFVCCAHYNVHKGLKFISAFYSPHNTTLCPLETGDGKEFSFSPLVEEAVGYLQTAKQEESLVAEADIGAIVQQYCFLFNGITFNWCISKGRYPMVELVKEALTDAVSGLLV